MENYIEKNQGLVVKLAKKYFCPSVDWDDLIQAGNVGLFDAHKHFDPSKAASFFTYAYFWVRKRIKEEVAKAHLVRVPTHIQEERNKQEDPEVCVTYSIESCVAYLAEKAQNSFRINLDSAYVQGLISKLPHTEKLVINCRLKGFTLAEIGKKLGISGQGVHLIEKKAIEHLKKM